MQKLTFDCIELKVDKTTHHSDLLDRFAQKLNPERIAAGYKPYNYPRLAKLLEGLTYTEREQLYHDCEKAKCGFGKYFGYKIKIKKI